MPENIQLISVVIPVLNEHLSLRTLLDEILLVHPQLSSDDLEVIFVDDGSTDDSWPLIDELVQEYPGCVKGLRLRRNFGKAVALNVGIHEAKGEIVFLMDADLQDSPNEMPKFLAEIDRGFDLVVGWKIDRKDPWHKVLPSKFFNFATSKLTAIRLHDFNCGFKCFRREVFEHLVLYGEMHRFIPVLANDLGYTISEVPVNHRPRTHGQSKYGLERFLRGAVDLVSVVFITRYSTRPAHVFGGLALILGIFSITILTYLSALWFMGLGPIGNRPLLSLGIFLGLVSVQLGAFGLLAELIARQRHAHNDETHMLVKTRLGSGDDDDLDP